MKIRKTTISDLKTVMKLYVYAKAYMDQNNNSNQWIKGYPSREIIQEDIIRGNSYVCLNSQEEIIGVFCFMQDEDPTYATIYQGKWLNNLPYGVIHRLAGNGKEKGIASFCFNWCLEQCKNIRIDTHADNEVMRHLLNKHGYQYCGIIYVANGTERLAFQKCEGSFPVI
ncbi:MAG: GNAT family N-acetyltransferase [Tannerellaceae bacterium]|nr:GNAT family N-acetyltransferase [Tannerellaceae bacterium]